MREKTNMDNRERSKGDMGKGLDAFLIVSALGHWSAYRGLFLTFPAAHSLQVFLISFHDRRTLII